MDDRWGQLSPHSHSVKSHYNLEVLGLRKRKRKNCPKKQKNKTAKWNLNVMMQNVIAKRAPLKSYRSPDRGEREKRGIKIKTSHDWLSCITFWYVWTTDGNTWWHFSGTLPTAFPKFVFPRHHLLSFVPNYRVRSLGHNVPSMLCTNCCQVTDRKPVAIGHSRVLNC